MATDDELKAADLERKRLGKAARDGDTKTVLEFLKGGGDPLAYVSAVTKETENEPDYRYKNYQGDSLLHIAARNGQAETVKAVLEHLRSKGRNMQEFLSQGAKDDPYGILLADASTKHPETLKVILDAGYDINKRTSSDGDTLMHLAALRGHDDTVKMLFQRGAKFEPIESTSAGSIYTVGETPLHSAARNGNSETVETILEQLSQRGMNVKAELDRKNIKGRTPLHEAVRKASINIPNGSDLEKTVAVLVRAGANPDALDNDGKKPIELAVFPDGSRDPSREKVAQQALQAGGRFTQAENEKRRRLTSETVSRPRT